MLGRLYYHFSYRQDGQAIAQVFPKHWMDRLLWLGFKAEVWLKPGKPETQGAFYRASPHSGTVALVLGAGNISAISAMDTLYKLFVEGEVVLLKMNPVKEYVGPFLAQAFDSLRQDGFFEVLYGGAEVDQYPTTWGAFPGNPLTDIGSGRGVVHNTYLFDHPQKSVLYAPFRIWPTPIWFSDHRNLKHLAQRYAALQTKPSLKNFLKVLLSALKS